MVTLSNNPRTLPEAFSRLLRMVFEHYMKMGIGGERQGNAIIGVYGTDDAPGCPLGIFHTFDLILQQSYGQKVTLLVYMSSCITEFMRI